MLSAISLFFSFFLSGDKNAKESRETFDMERPVRLPVSFPHTFVDFLVLCNNLV